MRHETRFRLIEKNFIDVKAVSAEAAWGTPRKFNAYHIWVPLNYADGLSQSLYIRSPRSTSDPRAFDAAGYVVSFSQEAIPVLRCQHLEPFGPVSSLVANEWVTITDAVSHRAMVRTLEKMSAGPDRENVCGIKRSLALLKVLIVHISRLYALGKTSTHASEHSWIVERFTQFLRSQDCARDALRHFTTELAISPTYLNVIIRNNLGCTPSRLVQHNLLQKAKHMAINSQESMKEVASRLGFSDMAHFSKFFSVGAGMTFTDFKRTYQNL